MLSQAQTDRKWNEEEGMQNFCLIGTEFQFGKRNKFWRLMMVNYLMPQKRALKMTKRANFVLYIVSQ